MTVDIAVSIVVIHDHDAARIQISLCWIKWCVRARWLWHYRLYISGWNLLL